MINIKEGIDTRLPKGDIGGLMIKDIRWDVKTAGPSPNNNSRIELFLLGCRRAIIGKPCKGCFNSSTWNYDKLEWTHDPIKVAEHINNIATSKYITISGGEPLDQIHNLTTLCEELKKYDFHILVYTWRRVDAILGLINFPRQNPRSINWDLLLLETDITKRDLGKLFETIDIIVDGEYIESQRLWDGTKADGLISSVGSGNQKIIDCNSGSWNYMRDLQELKLTKDNELIMIERSN